MLRRVRQLLFLLLLAVLGWSMWVGWRIVRGATLDETRKADAAIVMGAAAYGDKPSPVFEERINHAVELYQKGLVRKLILTGGFGQGAEHSESEVARSYAMTKGVPARDLLLEKKSRTTLENLQQARLIMQQHGLKDVLLVSDPLHMERVAIMTQDLGIPAGRSPTTTSKYVSFGVQAGFLAREIYAVTAYWIGGI